MIVPEYVEVVVAELVDGVERPARFAAACVTPGRQKRGGEVGLVPGASGKTGAGGSELPELQIPHAQRKLCESVVRIAGNEPLGKNERIAHVTVGNGGDESAFDQILVVRIEAQRLAKESLGRDRVALRTRDDGGEIIAGGTVADFERRRHNEVLMGLPCHRRSKGNRQSEGAHGKRNDRVRCETMRRQARILQDETGFRRAPATPPRKRCSLDLNGAQPSHDYALRYTPKHGLCEMSPEPVDRPPVHRFG